MVGLKYGDVAVHFDDQGDNRPTLNSKVYIVAISKDKKFVSYMYADSSKHEIKFDSKDRFKKIPNDEFTKSELDLERANFNAIIEQAELENFRSTAKKLLDDYTTFVDKCQNFVDTLTDDTIKKVRLQ